MGLLIATQLACRDKKGARFFNTWLCTFCPFSGARFRFLSFHHRLTAWGTNGVVHSSHHLFSHGPSYRPSQCTQQRAPFSAGVLSCCPPCCFLSWFPNCCPWLLFSPIVLRWFPSCCPSCCPPSLISHGPSHCHSTSLYWSCCPWLLFPQLSFAGSRTVVPAAAPSLISHGPSHCHPN